MGNLPARLVEQAGCQQFSTALKRQIIYKSPIDTTAQPLPSPTSPHSDIFYSHFYGLGKISAGIQVSTPINGRRPDHPLKPSPNGLQIGSSHSIK
jgi:hypothetical protein